MRYTIVAAGSEQTSRRRWIQLHLVCLSVFFRAVLQREWASRLQARARIDVYSFGEGDKYHLFRSSPTQRIFLRNVNCSSGTRSCMKSVITIPRRLHQIWRVGGTNTTKKLCYSRIYAPCSALFLWTRTTRRIWTRAMVPSKAWN